MRKYLIFLIIEFFFFRVTNAQKDIIRLTHTPNGVFIEVGAKERVGKSFEVFRRKEGETNFNKLAKVSPPQNIGDLEANIKKSKLVFDEGSQPDNFEINKIWENYQTRNQDLLNYIIRLPQLEFLFGMAYLDSIVVENSQYEYQIREEDGKVVTTAQTRYKKQIRFPSLIEVADSSFNGYGKDISLKFDIESQNNTLNLFVVKRKLFTSPASDFLKINPLVFYSEPDGSNVTLIDTSLNYWGYYNYQIQQKDIFGNRDTSVYTSSAGNIPFDFKLEIKNVKIESIKEDRAFLITWELPEKQLAQSLTLFKSRNFEGPFEEVAHFSPTESDFVSPIEIANELYFYYFEILDVFGKKHKSIKFQKVYEGTTIPIPPINLEVNENGNLSWKAGDEVTRGFYVFRKEGLEGDFIQVSPFIPVTDKSGYFLDSSAVNPDLYYYYSVKSESDTYDLSNFSDTLTFRPTNSKNNQLKPPYDVDVFYSDNSIIITWENMNDDNLDVLGYQVYRKSEKDREFILITPQIIPFYQNRLKDSLLSDGYLFEYYVVSTDGKGDFSLPGQPVSIDIADEYTHLPEELGYELDNKSILIKWTDVDSQRIKNIRIYRSVGDAPLQLISTVDGKLKSFRDTTVKNGNIYNYQVATVDSSGKEYGRTEFLTVKY